jgi:hypothetical protein
MRINLRSPMSVFFLHDTHDKVKRLIFHCIESSKHLSKSLPVQL